VIGEFAFAAHLRAAQRVRQAPQSRLHGGQGEGQQGIASPGVVMRDPITYLTSNSLQGERRTSSPAIMFYECSTAQSALLRVHRPWHAARCAEAW